MASTIRTKWGGTTWKGPAADGAIRVKWGGSSWIVPTYVRCKVNSTGGVTTPPLAPSWGGNWQDTGYRGYPAEPSSPWVHSWGYGNLQAAWSGGSGGAPADYWHVVLTDYSGNWLAQENSTDGYSPNWGVSTDTRYMVYVRSHAASGLFSNWSPRLQVGIGHPSSNNYGWVERTRGWTSDTPSGARNKDDPFWVGIPNRVYLTSMHWRNLRTGGQSSVVCPGTNREVNWILEGGDFGTIRNNTGTVYNGHNWDHAFGNWGTGQPWGIVARGAGWSTTGNGYYMLWCDGLWCHGTEYYDNYEVVSTNPAQGNYYW